ncbi:hemin import ATP-binding protein HmuV [Rhizocola hellebori]|uniref:Hemin import ATP-binding protein HmuV n=1 Tax=Rhizocola hellebori TaxID=1392758 RepID=A0A8J3QJ40_9ACTN|nr:heme ABC transporter ATP-binding protein [Rhizocola hellebori]GIH10358.1 hemin import ATP-binding protein HmuV [Rhizocola hellebori]
MISTDNVSYLAGTRQIISQISFSVPEKHLLSIVGPNGAGKSTLLALLAGDLRPASGQVLLAGQPVHRMRPAALARQRAVMPQSTALAFGFTAAEIVRMGTEHDDPAVARQALDQVGAADLAERSFPSLSGGEQARVTLARVIAQHTPVLMLDEPTAHLDIKHQHIVLNLARSLADAGRTVIAVLHDLNLAARYSDTIAIMREGRLVTVGTPTETLVAERLSDVYDHPIGVYSHPAMSAPLCLDR